MEGQDRQGEAGQGRERSGKARKGPASISDRLKERVCPNCGGKPERRSAKGPPPTFCSRQCKRSHNNRLLVEGRAVIGFLKAWRIDRGCGEIAQKSFAQVCEIVDLFNARDREAGIPRSDIYAATLLIEKTRYFDRQRPAKGKKEKTK
jgi:endogenous inhibitor of DNA gyrase (YacG/DUF329 family)